MERAFLNSIGKSNKFNIALISFPMGSSLVVNVFLSNLIQILGHVCNKVYVITSGLPEDKTFGSNIILEDIKIVLNLKGTFYPIWWANIIQILKIIIIQARLSLALIKLRNEFNLAFFYIGGGDLFLPILVAKLLNKKIVTSALGLGSYAYKNDSGNSHFNIWALISLIYSLFEQTNFYLSDLIIVESFNVINFFRLEKYEKKINIKGARYIDTKFFNITKTLNERKELVGYIGRLSTEKGVLNFVNCIPLVQKERNNLKFIIGGGGPLFGQIQENLIKNNLLAKVDLMDWVPHRSMVNHLNELKLLVLPSYSEGLPTVILEAMACGVPVLATPVGGIPDIIIDGETGFLIENNSPECIAAGIERVLNFPNLNKIIANSRRMIERDFSYEAAVTRYSEILS